MKPFLQRLASCAECWVSCYPNAGLPNAFGGYDETPESMGVMLREFAEAFGLPTAGGRAELLRRLEASTVAEHVRGGRGGAARGGAGGARAEWGRGGAANSVSHMAIARALFGRACRCARPIAPPLPAGRLQ